MFTDNPEEIAAFMDGIRGNGGGDGKKKQSERERLSELVEVRGKLYHKNTTNRPAKLANWINSLFGGDSDYFVEHKPYNSDEQEFNDNLQATALGVGGAHLVGKAVVGVLSSSAARSTSNIAVQFGKTENQIFHAFRHTDALGLDRSVVQSTIQNHFKTVSSQVVAGKPLNQIVEIGGQRIQYTAFKLPDGTFNIGRIHGIK